METHLRAELVLAALEMAIGQRTPRRSRSLRCSPADFDFGSDRGEGDG